MTRLKKEFYLYGTFQQEFPPRSNVSGVARIVAAIGGYMTLTMGLMLRERNFILCFKIANDFDLF